MIHTYTRKWKSLKPCSFYERLCGDPLAECSAVISPIEDDSSNGCYSKEIKEDKRKAWCEDGVPNITNFIQSPPCESFNVPPLKFKYTRRSKSLCSSGRSLHYVAAPQLVQEASQRMSEAIAVQPGLENWGCISYQNKLALVDQNHDIRSQVTAPYSSNSSSGKQSDITDKCLGALENAGSLCYDSCTHNHCIDIATNDAGQLNSGLAAIDSCSDGSSSSNVSNRVENEIGRGCLNISAKRGSELDCKSTSNMHKPDSKGRDATDCQNCHELVKIEWSAPLLTYTRRSCKDGDARRTYVDLLAERTNYVVSDQSLSGSADAVPKIIERSTSETVLEHSASFSPPIEKLTDGISAIGVTISSQGNQKNSCQLIDDIDGSKIPSLNDEAVTGQQSDDAIKPHHNICDLSIHTAYESSAHAKMQDTFQAALENTKNQSIDQRKAGVASKDFSDKLDKVDCNLAASTTYAFVLSMQSEALQRSVERNLDASLPVEVPGANANELLEIMTEGGGTGTNNLPDFNLQPSKDGGFIYQNSKMVYSITLPNGSTNNKVFQLFPEDIRDSARLLGTSNSVGSKNSSGTVAQPGLSRAFIRDKMFEPSCSQEMHKLLQDNIKSWNRPQIGISDGCRQNFQAFTSFWSEEELDSLWVGVRRHGKGNWSAMLRDPKLRFSPWRTPMDLAEKWIMEQSKLLGNTPGPYCQNAKQVGISTPPNVPPGPGSLTRFLTDPTQLSLSNAYLNNQGMFPPRPPLNAPGNGTRLFNRRVRAHKRSQYSENIWGRFKARNQVISPPKFPTPLASTSRNDTSPPCVRDTFDCPHPRVPLPVPPLSIQLPGNSSQLHGKMNNKGLGISRRNSNQSSNIGLDCPGLVFPLSQSSRVNPIDPKRPKELINLDSDASSEGTISDNDKPTTICKYN